PRLFVNICGMKLRFWGCNWHYADRLELGIMSDDAIKFWKENMEEEYESKKKSAIIIPSNEIINRIFDFPFNRNTIESITAVRSVANTYVVYGCYKHRYRDMGNGCFFIFHKENLGS